MATRFAQQFARAGAPSLVDGFGESIVYFGVGSVSGRCIDAMIERDVEVPSETGDQVVQALVVRVLDDCTLGISSTELNDGGDEVSISLKVGGPATRRQVGRRIQAANGLVRFLVR